MGAGFLLNLEANGWADVEADIKAMPRQLDLAAARALRKTGQWLRTHSTREISRSLRITQIPIRNRFLIDTRATAREVKVWVGLNPLSVHYLGTPRQTTTGVKVGHREYDDAFISPMETSARLVWRRKGRERLPIERVTEDWEAEGFTVLERWEKRAMERFVEIFESEARHALEGNR